MDSSIGAFTKGVQNLFNSEEIAQDAAQDALGFVTQDGKTKMIPGRKAIGALGTFGQIRELNFGYTNNGKQVLFRRTETAYQALIAGTWTDIAGANALTSGNEGMIIPYSSLAGTFVIMAGADGLFKVHTANPTTAINLYDAVRNDKGKILINKGRLFMWDLVNASKTTIKMSWIDAQDGTVYTTVLQESIGTGDGATKHFTGTLAFKTADAARNAFGIRIAAATTTPTNISAITQATSAQITSNTHGLSVGDFVVIEGVVGMLNINKLIGTVLTVVDANNVTVNIPTTGFTPYTSGGTIGKAEVLTDDRNGNFTSPAGSTGTVNYASGAVDVTFFAAPKNSSSVVTDYQYENSNQKGITDFTFSNPRNAGEGNRVTQDAGGDPIVSILIGQDGAYYSLKQQSAWRLDIATDDKTYDNNIFYQNMGMPSFRAGVSTQKGIIFMNTSNPDKPEMTILEKNAIGDTIIPVVLFGQFKFANYDWSDASFDTYERYIIVGCKQQGSTYNDRILLCNIEGGTVDISPYEARMFAKDNQANIFAGSPISQTVYQIYNGFDDTDNIIQAYWISKAEQYGSLKIRAMKYRFISEALKKFRRLRIKGHIGAAQAIAVYADYDDAGFQLVGAIRGDGSYVDYSDPEAVGANFIGGVQIGGDVAAQSYPYFLEIKIAAPKFRKRVIKIVPIGIGYFDFDFMSDWDIMIFENRIPKRFRQKQRVSLDGTKNNQ